MVDKLALVTLKERELLLLRDYGEVVGGGEGAGVWRSFGVIEDGDVG
jgi:hypothetical protein